jgi:putative SOS response-associated peptidase YedK
MCNLYSLTKGQVAIRTLARAMRDHTGNLPPLPGIFPDQMAPIVRTGEDSKRELLMMRWGFPSPPVFGNPRPVTNVRNVKSAYWKRWLKLEQRCLVPATSFCEYHDKPDPKTKRKTPHWFALSEKRPLFFFAGIWRPWKGTRGTKAEPVEGEHLLFSFLTTDSNKDVKPIHAKAMPVILTTPEEADTWLIAPVEKALKLQRALPAGMLEIVATGEKKDAV